MLHYFIKILTVFLFAYCFDSCVSSTADGNGKKNIDGEISKSNSNGNSNRNNHLRKRHLSQANKYVSTHEDTDEQEKRKLWEFLQKIEGDAGDECFGALGPIKPVAINGDGRIAAVGEPGNDDGADFGGKVSVYERQPTESTYEPKGDPVVGTLENGCFGYSLALSQDGNTLVVGDPVYDSVFVYKYNSATNDWDPLGQPLDGDTYSYLGASVDISADGTIVLAGAPSSFYNGYARIWKLNEASDNWDPFLTYDYNDTTSYVGKIPGDEIGFGLCKSIW